MNEKKILDIDKNTRLVYPEDYTPSSKDCPICELTFRDSQDISCFKEWKCCTDCRDSYAWHNKEKWNKGWRPKIKNLT